MSLSLILFLLILIIDNVHQSVSKRFAYAVIALGPDVVGHHWSDIPWFQCSICTS